MLTYVALVAIGNFLLGFGFAAWRERRLAVTSVGAVALAPAEIPSPPQPYQEFAPVAQGAPDAELDPRPNIGGANAWSHAVFESAFALELPSLRRQWLDLQAAAENAEPTTLAALAAEFQTSSQTWAKTLDTAAQPLRERARELPACHAWAERLECSLTRLAQQFQEAASSLQTASQQASPEMLRQGLRDETERLLHEVHDLRDERNEAHAAILAAAGGLDALTADQVTDPQTRLPNRLGLEQLRCQWRREQGELAPWSLAVLDIDGFGALNRRLGIAGGDGLLAGFATVLEDLVRKERGFDRATRYCADSFVLFLGDTDADSAVNGVERIRQTLEASSFTVEGGDIALTVSLGVAAANDTETLTEALARAEEALRLAQETGGNCTCQHTGAEVQEEPARPFQVKGRIVHLAQHGSPEGQVPLQDQVWARE